MLPWSLPCCVQPKEAGWIRLADWKILLWPIPAPEDGVMLPNACLWFQEGCKNQGLDSRTWGLRQIHVLESLWNKC